MSYLDDAFGPAGFLARHVSGYAPRPGQIQLAHAIDRAFTSQQHLLAEGPTGTGKSFAYGVPALYHAATRRRRVLIVTANIALQEQLVKSDFPELRRMVPWQATVSLLKGKSNYLCLDRLHAERTHPRRRDYDDPDAVVAAVHQWARETETGDRSELAVHPSHALWRRFSVSSRDCKANACDYRDQCFAYAAREQAEHAPILVTNYHLLFVHVQVKAKTGMDLVLPPFDLVVCDEAHKAADIARDFFGYRITQRTLRWVGRGLHAIGATNLLVTLHESVHRFYAALQTRSEETGGRLRAADHDGDGDGLDWQPVVAALGKVSWAYKRAMARERDEHRRMMLRRYWVRAELLAERVESAVCLTQPDHVSYIATIDNELTLGTKAVHVAEPLQAGVFAAAGSVVMTSATLSTHGKFAYIAKELGLVNPATIAVESPFAFHQQAILVVPDAMPHPNDEAFPEAVAQTVKHITDLAQGRTLALFTSYKNLEQTYAGMASSPYRVLKQGDAPRMRLIDEFRRDTHSILLGTESFWAGIDVPGESLSCVIIDRLPFPSPEDPVADAISEQDARWFVHYSLPRAVIAFRQGVGRLIRSVRDRGVVVLLDQRIVTKRYGAHFLRSLPEMLRSRRLQRVADFLAADRTGLSTWNPPT